MADNTTQTGTDTIATDDVATLNGGASSGVKVQRVKVAFGDDGDSRDVSALFPLPISRSDNNATGTITATDTVVGVHGGLGVPLSGTPTAGSYVAYKMLGGEGGFTLRLSGTFGGGIVWMESSVDSTNGVDGAWTTNLVRQSGIDVTFIDASLTSAGIFRGTAAGYSYLRLRMTGATAPSVTVALRASTTPSVTALVASIPAGGNSIGTVGLNAGTNTIGTVGLADGQKATYSASFDAIASTAGTDVFTITGSATRTVRITRVSLVGVATAANSLRVLLIRRSGAYSGGTSTAATITPHDSTSAASSVVVRAYTANATGQATFVGWIRTGRLIQTVPAGAAPPLEWTFGNRPSQGVLLRGATEHMGIAFPATPGAGSTFSFDVEWTEE